MKIAIYGKAFTDAFMQIMDELAQVVVSEDIQLVLHQSLHDHLISINWNKLPQVSRFSSPDDFPADTNFLISIGGDGSFLETIQFVKKDAVPLIGINSGRLGFLADISKTEVQDALREVLSGQYKIENRVLIQLLENHALPEFPNYALNEICIHKLDNSAMITIHVYLGDEYLNSYWADGLIISTPTGSTAYNLSAGGPIVLHNSKSFILTPIAPHTLTVRPLVIPNTSDLRIKVEGRSEEYLVSLDHRSYRMKMENPISIQKADFDVKLIKPQNHSFLKTLRQKLAWGTDKRN
jgi:NAD+ kinase